MQAVIDSIKGEYFRCLLENGDLINIHKSYVNEEIVTGDIIKIEINKDVEATKKQKELMK
ncbi:MAG: DUF3006 family protein [Candidatus Rifleibacteriota bacterium]